MSEPREVGTSRAIDPAFDAAALTRYYRWHAPLYDATRWSFLFGRAALIRGIALHRRPRRILEVGCGTGANLLRLSRWFPCLLYTSTTDAGVCRAGGVRKEYRFFTAGHR